MTLRNRLHRRRHIDEAFDARQLKANIVLEAMDADVIKTYVESCGSVLGSLRVAYEPQRDLRKLSGN
jgi:hypothetical protein